MRPFMIDFILSSACIVVGVVALLNGHGDYLDIILSIVIIAIGMWEFYKNLVAGEQ